MSEAATLEDAYLLGEELGRGAFGRVVAATRRRDEVPVAVKIHHHALTADAAARIEREVALVAGLEHPCLATLYEALPSREGALALVYERIDGEGLEARLARGPLSVEAGLRLARDVAGALGALHGAGLAHRDVKPGNVRLAGDGRAVLLDYGLVRAVEGGSTLTATGMILGTPATMAPEQAAGERVGPPADQYALACLLFEAWTGAPPFEGEVFRILEAHLSAPPPGLRDRRPDLSGGLDRALRRALEKRPEDRFPDLGAFAAALEDGSAAGEAAATMAVELPAAQVEAKARGTRSLVAGPDSPEAPPPASRGLAAGAACAVLGLALAARVLVPSGAPPRVKATTDPIGVRLHAAETNAATVTLTLGGHRVGLPPGAEHYLPFPEGADSLEVEDPEEALGGAGALTRAPRPDPAAATWAVLPGSPPTLELHVDPSRPPPARVRFERAEASLSADAEPAADPRTFRAPRALLAGWPTGPGGSLVPAPSLRARGLYGLAGDLRVGPVVAPSLPGEVKVLGNPCFHGKGKDGSAEVASGPVPWGTDRLLYADRHGTLYEAPLDAAGPVRPWASRAEPVEGRWAPFLAPAGGGAAWLALGGLRHVTRLPGDLRPGGGSPVRWSLGEIDCPEGAVRPLPSSLEVVRGEGDEAPWPPLGDDGPEPTLDGAAWIRGRLWDGPLWITASREGRAPTARRGEFSHGWTSALLFPAFRSRGGWVLGFAEHMPDPVEEEVRRTRPDFDCTRDCTTHLLSATEDGEVRWRAAVTPRPQAPPAPGPGGVFLLHDGRLRFVPDAVLGSRGDGPVDLGDPRVQEVHDFEDSTIHPRERRFTAWLHWREDLGLDVFFWPRRDLLREPDVALLERLPDAPVPLEWHRFAPGPPFEKEPGIRRLDFGRLREPHLLSPGLYREDRKVGIAGARPVGGRDLLALAALDEHHRARVLLLDLPSRTLLAEHDFGAPGIADALYPKRTPLALPPPPGAAGLTLATSDQEGTLYLWHAPVGTPPGVPLSKE